MAAALVSAAVLAQSAPACAGFYIPGKVSETEIFFEKSEANIMSVERFCEEYLEVEGKVEPLEDKEKNLETRDYSVLPRNAYDDQGLFFVSV